jgi:hypothetical protein
LENEIMKRTFLNERKHGADSLATLRPIAGYEVNVALVYEDHATHHWAGQVRDKLAELIGGEAIHCTEWNINDLKEPSTYSRGVAALARADVIVVSVSAAERFPSAFYLWVNLWLQVRSGLPGALVALVVPTEQSNSGAMETRRYLHAVASQGRLELLECKYPDAPIRGLREDMFDWPKAAAVVAQLVGSSERQLVA